jgi:hypothetical protein
MSNEKFFNAMLVFLLSLVFLISVSAAAETGAAQPQLPHAFYGKVEIGGNPGSQGLVVESVGPGVHSGVAGNPVMTMAGGIYGLAGMASQKLLVQGDIEPGTPLEFYVGGTLAEVYDLSAGGPWKANYSYTPGGLTELNLRIASLPSAGQTREPTPVETRLPAEQVPAGYMFTGLGLPQPGVVETYIPGQSTGNQPAAGSTHTPDNSGQIPAQDGVRADQTVEGSIPVLPVDTGSTGMLIGAGVVTIIVVLGGIFYYLNKKQSGNNKKEG